MQDYTKLKVWKKAHAVTLEVYTISKDFPREELYGLTSQLRRAIASVPMNLAEGCGRSTSADTARFFDVAFGSANEAEYQLLLARDLDYIGIEPYRKLSADIAEVKRMLAALIKKLRTDDFPNHHP